jgi:dsDNA-specific endonuclease/ATPase MutS2
MAATGSCFKEAGGPDCLYVDPDDMRALAQAIRQLLYEDNEREERLRTNSTYISRFESSDVAAADARRIRKRKNR